MICLTWCITHNLNIWNILRHACSRFCSVFLNLNYFILFCGSFRDNDEKKPRFGSLPVLNMPKRSHDTKPKQRTPRCVHVVKDHLPLPRQAVYKNFKELCQWTSGLRSLRWLKTVSSSFQDVDFDVSLLPLFINWCYNHGIKKLPNHWWTCWYYFRDTIGYHSNAMTC